MSSARSRSPDISAATATSADRQAGAESADVPARARGDGRNSAEIVASGRLFMYAEDWIYAPAVTKTAEILRASKDKILFMKAEESHSGSHAAHAAHWSMTGGGSLIRMGCHPLSAVLYLKQVEPRRAARPSRSPASRRHRQPRRRAQAGGARLHQGRPGRRRGLGHADPHLLRRQQGDDLFRRNDHGRGAQPGRDLYQRRRRCSPTSRPTITW